MNMNSNRFKLQVFIEQMIGCTEVDKWKSYSQALANYELNDVEATEASTALKIDAIDLYYKCCFSIAKSINSIYNGHHSWAVVKLYYSIFYGMRAELAARNIGFVKSNGIYTWKLEEGEKPEKADGRRARGDHATTIKTFKNIMNGNDIECNNKQH